MCTATKDKHVVHMLAHYVSQRGPTGPQSSKAKTKCSHDRLNKQGTLLQETYAQQSLHPTIALEYMPSTMPINFHAEKFLHNHTQVVVSSAFCYV